MVDIVRADQHGDNCKTPDKLEVRGTTNYALDRKAPFLATPAFVQITATKARFHHLTRWRDDHLAARRTCAAAPNANDWLGRYEDAATDRSGS